MSITPTDSGKGVQIKLSFRDEDIAKLKKIAKDKRITVSELIKETIVKDIL